MTRTLTLLNVALVVALIGGSVYAWPDLPPQIPAHFDAGGRADAWAERSPMRWFLLPALAVLVGGVMQLSQSLVRRHPALLNIPDKDEYLALPEAGKREVLVHVRAMLAATMGVMLAIFALIQLAIWRQAHGHATTTLLMVVLVLGVLTTPLLLGVFLPRIRDEIEEQQRRR
jgi:uncharacterized membrane protein